MAQIAILAVMAVAALNEGAQKRKMQYQKGQFLTEAGHRQMAATSAEVAEAEREKERVQGRAVSVAAASGGGVDDPTVVNLIGDLNAEGTYRMMAKLYAGSDEALGIYNEAEMARREGDAALQAGYVKAAKTVMSSYGSFGAMGAEASSQFGAMKGKISSIFNKGGPTASSVPRTQVPA